jgi:hypothetical protein
MLEPLDDVNLHNDDTHILTSPSHPAPSAAAAAAAADKRAPPTQASAASAVLARVAPPARIMHVPQQGPAPAPLAAARRQPGLGVVIVGKSIVVWLDVGGGGWIRVCFILSQD